METITTSLQLVIEAFNLQTRLFKNVIKDISEEHASDHFAGSPNHISWIVGHIVSTRFSLGTVLGLTDREPYPELFEKGQGIKESAYPSIEKLTAGWDEFAEKLIATLQNLNEDELQADPPVHTPINENTLRGFITFLCHHEAYHIGQLSLARRIFGYEPMSYS